jgi:FMN-dependent NADH-azoreductase
MRTRLFTSVVTAVAVIGCGSGVERTATLTDADLDAIASLRTAVTAAILEGDAAAYAVLCTDDVRLLHPDNPLITGRAELEAHNAAIFEAVTVTSLTLTPVEVYGEGDLAYEVGTQQLLIEPAMPGFSASRKYVHVMRRNPSGVWRFAALISNDT